MVATLLQLVGLVAVIAGGVVLAGLGGALVASGCAAVYLGLAAEAR